MEKRYTVIVYVNLYGSTIHHFHDVVTTLSTEALETYFWEFNYGEGEITFIEVREDLTNV